MEEEVALLEQKFSEVVVFSANLSNHQFVGA